jgi:hypothetical protein
MSKKYTKIYDSKDDQRIFEDEDGGIYFVDHSGEGPEYTDDGPLRWIPTDSLVSGRFGLSSKEPVFDASVECLVTGEEGTVMFNMGPAEFLSKKFDIPIRLRVNGKTYTLEEQMVPVKITVETTVPVEKSQLKDFKQRQFDIVSIDPSVHPRFEPEPTNHGHTEVTIKHPAG